MLLAEELALVAIRPDSGRHLPGMRSELNACLAGLLVAEAMVEGLVRRGDRDDHIVVVGGRPAPSSASLAAVADLVAEKGPKTRAVLSHMGRGLHQRLGTASWDTVVAGLIAAGAVGPSTGLLYRHRVLDTGTRSAIVARLRAAAAGDGPLDLRTALVLSMTGPIHLLEVVAPDRSARKHARNRIDHALDGSDLELIGRVVRRMIRDAASAAA